ncbi:hypothetical protein ACC677_38815, partial [Rhizobium ruizarguesonis]
IFVEFRLDLVDQFAPPLRADAFFVFADNRVQPELDKYRALAEQMTAFENDGKTPEAISLFKENMEPQAELVNKAVA